GSERDPAGFDDCPTLYGGFPLTVCCCLPKIRRLRGGAMRRRLKQAVVVIVVVFAAAQLIRPARKNPAIDVSRTIQANCGTNAGLVAVLDRACGDCHSNATVWPRYAQVAPLSWLMARAVAEGQKAVNFSEWAAHSPEQQRLMLAASCDDATSGKMPGAYRFFKPDTRLSPPEIQTICAAARQRDVVAAGSR